MSARKNHTSTDSTDRDIATETSPSTGPRQTAEVFHAVYGLGDPELRATCNPGDADLKDFFEVSS